MKNNRPSPTVAKRYDFPTSGSALRCGRSLWSSLLLLSLIGSASAQTYNLTNVWYIPTNAAGTHIATGDVNRGLAYGLISNQVFVCNKGISGSGTTPAIDVFDGTAGTFIGNVYCSNLSVGTFRLDQIGVADDGAIYGANLSTSVGATAFKVYRWATWTDTNPATCFIGDPTGGNFSGGRMGDTLTVTGAGTNTLILAEVGSGTTPTTNIVLFSTVDGTNFTPTLLQISGLPGLTSGNGPAFGYAFYTNNTFMFKPSGSSAYLVQYPANFASLGSPVAATVVATNSFGGNNVLISYNASAKLLGAVGPMVSAGPTVLPITLYSLPTFAGLATLASTNTPHTNANGNFVGGCALGGAGKTNYIYALDCNNGVQASQIIFTAAPVPPSITTAPTGGTVYTNVPSFTLTVVAQGSQPLSYQWQFNTVSNLATATNIVGATNASYTLTFPPTNDSGWYDVAITNIGGHTSSVPVLLTVLPPASSVVVTQLWSIAPGNTNYPYLDNSSYDTRGLGYDSNTMTVLVADKGAMLGIYVLDANTGTNLFTLNTLGIGVAGDQFPIDQVGVGDDGVAYACNLTLAGSASSFAVFSWSSISSNATPAFAFQADPGNGSGDRWGDTMAVRGAGVNTEILLGSYTGFGGGPGTNVALLTTMDGSTFTATTLVITNLPAGAAGFSSLGIAFGAGNTFWAKSPGYDLRQISFDPVSGNAAVIQDYPSATSGASSFPSMSAIGVDPGNNIVAGVTFNDVPNDLSLYQISTNGIPPYLFDQVFFPSLNGNIQENGATAVKFPRIYSLDVNNGIVALSYGVPAAPPLPPFSFTAITNQTGTGVTLTWQSFAGRTYQVQSTSSLTSVSWGNLGAPIVATGSTTSYTDANNTGTATFYRVVGH